MKAKHVWLAILALVIAVGVAQAAPNRIELKAGDAAYVCGCGDKCGCEVVSLKAGKCGCGHELTRVTITKVKGKKAAYEAGGKEATVKLAGKYSCACGSDCCQMISQKPGKCVCGKELVKAEKNR